jgi:hypothetical protein
VTLPVPQFFIDKNKDENLNLVMASTDFFNTHTHIHKTDLLSD